MFESLTKVSVYNFLFISYGIVFFIKKQKHTHTHTKQQLVTKGHMTFISNIIFLFLQIYKTSLFIQNSLINLFDHTKWVY